MTKPPTNLREEIVKALDLGKPYYDYDWLPAANALEALITRERKAAAEEILTRLKVPDYIDEWGAIDRVLDEMFPNSK